MSNPKDILQKCDQLVERRDKTITRQTRLVPQGGSQKAYNMGFSWILNGLFIYADLY